MTVERTLHAWGRGWDAADAVAARMRIESMLHALRAPRVEVGTDLQGQAIMSLGTPAQSPVSHRLGADGRTLMAVCAIPSEDEDGGRLAFGLSGHPSISGFALDMPLGRASRSDSGLIHETEALVARLTLLLDTVSTTTDLLLAGRRADAVARRRDASTVATSARTVIAAHWIDRGMLTGPLATVLATMWCPTPWTVATMDTKQAVFRQQANPADPSGMLPNRRVPILDAEGRAILEDALSMCVEIEWNPDTRTPDGHQIRRMHVAPASFTGMISRNSLPDSMEMLRAHRLVPIPDRCVTGISS